MPKLRHTYASTRRATLGGVDFLLDTWVESYPSGTPPAPDIDLIRRAEMSVHVSEW